MSQCSRGRFFAPGSASSDRWCGNLGRCNLRRHECAVAGGYQDDLFADPSVLVRRLVLEKAGAAAACERARGFHSDADRLGARAHLARPEIGLQIHVRDITNIIKYEDLRNVVLVGNSSGGMVITGVADHMPNRIAHLVFLDAFVPTDGQSMLDVIPPDRRPALEAFVQKEGDGWLLPRFAPPPWEKLVIQTWQVTEKADLEWILPRLRPTPFGHFKEPVTRKNPAAEKLPRTYIRTQSPHPGFDRYADAASAATGWQLRKIASSHLPEITHPSELAGLLLEVAR